MPETPQAQNQGRLSTSCPKWPQLAQNISPDLALVARDRLNSRRNRSSSPGSGRRSGPSSPDVGRNSPRAVRACLKSLPTRSKSTDIGRPGPKIGRVCPTSPRNRSKSCEIGPGRVRVELATCRTKSVAGQHLRRRVPDEILTGHTCSGRRPEARTYKIRPQRKPTARLHP